MKTQRLFMFLATICCVNSLPCQKNEKYSKCGTACPGTCSQPIKNCTKECAAGCFCKPGYILDDESLECIKKADCYNTTNSTTPSTVCPINEEFLECGTACPAACNYKPEVCTTQCVQGCFCKKGYVRIVPGGPCVLERTCDNYKCRRNEVFSTCATLCPQTCNNDGPKVCPLVCRYGCVCKPGFIRENEEGRCIPEDGCKEVCGENRVYSECGTACPGSCSEPIKKCEKICVKGCLCKNGYVLQEGTNKCVKLEECKRNEK